MAVINFIQVRCRLAKREVGTNVMHVIGEFVGAGWRWRRRVLSGGLGQRTCLRFQALAKVRSCSPFNDCCLIKLSEPFEGA